MGVCAFSLQLECQCRSLCCCRQPELFQGVTLDEYETLRASGKIDAYGFSTSNSPLIDEALTPDEAAAQAASPASAQEPAAAIPYEHVQAGGIISLSSGYVDPLG